jgi:hypothetical protein
MVERLIRNQQVAGSIPAGSSVEDRMKRQNVGLSVHRLSREPLERIFAEEWVRENTSACPGVGGDVLLDWLLAAEPNHPKGEVTQRDATVAATVIQWLGSPVGQGFLRRVRERARMERVRMGE